MRHVTRGACVALALVQAVSLQFTMAQAAPPSGLASAGGWSSVSHKDEAVVRAARFALHEQARQSHAAVSLLAIKHARQQAVNGTQISMNLMVQADGKRRLIIAVVWVRPDGSMELTRWHWV